MSWPSNGTSLLRVQNNMASTSDDDSISLLMSMGFESSQAKQALKICDGNVQRAVECLLGGNLADISTANASLSTSSNDGGANSIIQSEVTQYSNPLGRSACTAIALTLAHKSLELLNIDPVATPELRIESALLTTSINEGIQLYSNLIANHNCSGCAEHSSVEDLLNACSTLGNNENNYIMYALKLLPNSPRQGILSSNNDQHNNVMGLEALLAQCQTDAATVTEKQAYIAVVITKPPETILVILPNNDTASTTTTTTSTSKYILIDSHPRPQQLSPHYPTGSYALFHPTLSSLVSSLKELFPVTELGDGVPELMQMMYNSFDVYPFQLFSEE